MTTKTYILQKDLPDAKAGDSFIDDGVNIECYKQNNASDEKVWYGIGYIKKHPEWFKLEENHFVSISNNGQKTENYLENKVSTFNYSIRITKEIPKEMQTLMINWLESTLLR